MRAKKLLLLTFFLPLISCILPVNTTFAASPDTLYVTNAGNGNGVIHADGINCGSDCSETYTYWFISPTKEVTYTLSPDSWFAGWSGDCTGTGTCEVRMNQDRNVTATFYKINYTIEPSAGTGGTINPNTTQLVPYDTSRPFTITPDEHYLISDLQVDGSSVTFNPDVTTYTFDNVREDHTISATFVRKTYTILATVDGNGTIDPSGINTVDSGTSHTYTITPATPGYHVQDVTVDGASVGAVTTYEFSNVGANHTIHAVFSPDLFDIISTAGTTATPGALDGCSNGTGGSINPLGVTQVPFGGAQTYTGSIHTGYHLDQIYVNGAGIGVIEEEGSYTFNNVTTDQTITACFLLNQYTITLDYGDGTQGTISGPATVNHGDNPEYTVSAATGYHIVEVKLDGSVVKLAPASPYTYDTLDNVTTDHTISATFAIDTFPISVTQGSNGTISPVSATVPYDGSQQFLITPDEGYHIVDVLVDGASQGAISSYTFTHVVDDTHTISASFAIDVFPITVSSGTGGLVTPPASGNGTVNADWHTSPAFAITPDTGYEIVNVIVDGDSKGAITGYTFTNIEADHTISATFATTSHTITAVQTANGTISPASAVVGDNGSHTFTIEPSPGYYIVDVLVDLDAAGSGAPVSVGPVSSYEFVNVDDDATITATYLPGYVIQTSKVETDGAAGTIAVAPPFSIDASGRVILDANGTDDPSFTFTASTGFVTDVLLGGVTQGAVTRLDLTNVAADTTLEVHFGTGWTITVNPETNISPISGQVSPDATPTYTITPDPGYRVSGVQVDGSAVTCTPLPAPDTTNGCTYQFAPVQSNHLLYATFLPGYVITATSGPNGSISDEGENIVSAGGSMTFTFAPDTGYKVAEVFKNGISQGVVPEVTFSNVYSNQTVGVTFVEDTYTINASKTGNGTIDPEGAVSVTYGDDQTFDFTPGPGHHIAEILVDGTPLTNDPLPTSYTFPAVDAPHAIAVTFEPDLFDIISSIDTDGTPGGAGGSISPAGTTPVPYGGSQTYTGTIAEGFHLDHIDVDGTTIPPIDEDGSYTISNVGVGSSGDACDWADDECTITAFFITNTYDITTSAGTGGTITPGDEADVPHGADRDYEVTADEGFTINEVIVNGVVTSAPASPYQVELRGISSDIDITATFTQITFTLIAEHTAGGVIYPAAPPSSPIIAPWDSSQTFVFWEAENYYVNQFLLDGVLQPAPLPTSYTFEHIKNNHHIWIDFAEGNVISATAGAGGTISPADDVVVAPNGSQTFTFTPADASYHVDDVVVDGVSMGAMDSYTFDSVKNRHTISVTFKNNYIISVSADGDGTVDPAGPEESALAGLPKTFTFTADPANIVRAVFVDNVLIGAPDSYTFPSVADDHSLHVVFGPDVTGDDYQIHVGSGDNGHIEPVEGDVPVSAGADYEVIIVADSGYAIADVIVDNVSVGPVSRYQFDDIQSDHWIYATFRLDAYIIKASAGTGGDIAPKGDVGVTGGQSTTFDMSTVQGYELGPVTGTCGGTVNTLTETFTTNAASQDCTVEATFVSSTTKYWVTPSVNGGHGTISTSTPQQVVEGGIVSFLLTPNVGYTLGTVNSTCGGTLNTQQSIFTTFAISQDCTVEASFVSDTGVHYDVTSSASLGGHVSPERIQSLAEGEVLTYFLLPDPGFTIGSVAGTCGGTLNTQTNTFTTFPVSRDCTVEATFVYSETGPFRVTSSTGPGGTINQLGQQNVASGEVLTFSLYPEPDHIIGPVTGTCGGSLNTQTNIFTTLALTQDCTIIASFIATTEPEYEVTSSVLNSTGGAISQLGAQNIDKGGVLTFTLHPNEGYAVGPVTGTCGGSLNTQSFTFTTLPVTQPCTVVASFVDTTTGYTVSSSANTGGSIHLDGDQTIAEGGMVSFALLPETGYAIGPVTGTCGGTIDTQTHLFTTNPMTKDCTVIANFVDDSDPAILHMVTSSAGSNGTITPLGVQEVADGGIITFAVQADNGFALGPVSGTCGGTFNTISKTFTTNPVSRDCTVEATFVDDSDPAARIDVTPSVTAAGGGSIVPDTVQQVAPGGVITFLLLPEADYTIGAVSGTCGGTLDAQAQIFTTYAVQSPCTVIASFVDDSGSSTRHTVTSAAGANGSIFQEGSFDVADGAVMTFALLPAPGYAVGPVTGTCTGTVDTLNNLFTTNPVTADCTIVANFVADSDPADHFTVTSSAAANGTITPLGNQEVAAGGIITFTVQADTDYAFGPVGGTCGGTLNTLTKTYTTNPINRDCTVEATFVSDTPADTHYTVDSSVLNNTGGTITPDDPTVAEGGVITFQLTPAADFAIQTVEGTCGGMLDRQTGTYTTSAVLQDCTVVASFVSDTPADRHTVTSSAGIGGNIHLAGTQEVADEVILTFAILPMDGYSLGPIAGTCGGTLNSQTKLFTTHPVTQDCTVEATFVATTGPSYTVTASAGANGAITPEGAQSVAQGGVASFNLLPDAGFALGPVEGTCGGTLDTSAQTFTIFAVSQDCTVEATFVALGGGTDLTVTASAGAGGAISPEGAQTVAPGGVITFALLPESNFAIGPVNGTCTGLLDTQAKTFTTDAVTVDCTVEATFIATGGAHHAVTTSVAGQGSIAPTEYPAVPDGGAVSFRLYPAPYYSVASVSGCNGTLSGKTYFTGPVTSDCQVVASFVNNAYALTVTKIGKGLDKAMVTSDQQPDPVCTDNVCTGNYAGTVILTAETEGSAKFIGWTGCTSEVDNTCTVEMNGAKDVTAEFYYFPWPMFMPAATGAGH